MINPALQIGQQTSFVRQKHAKGALQAMCCITGALEIKTNGHTNRLFVFRLQHGLLSLQAGHVSFLVASALPRRLLRLLHHHR